MVMVYSSAEKFIPYPSASTINIIIDMKKITLRYFNVNSSAFTLSESLVRRLKSKLDSSASSRMMTLNRQASDKSDVISDFLTVLNDNIIAGTYLRIANSADVPIVTEEMLGMNQFKVSTINKNANKDERTCLDYFYFCLSDSRLIVTLDSRSTISRFETYINWLLNTKDSGEIISFTPEINQDTISVSDLKKITINTNSSVLTDGNNPAGEINESSVISITKNVLRKLFSDTDSLEELIEDNICSAKLVINFSKPKSMSVEDYKLKTMGASLKQIEDPENIKIQTNGKKLKGSDVLKTEIVDVEDDGGAISEQEIYQKMIQKIRLS